MAKIELIEVTKSYGSTSSFKFWSRSANSASNISTPSVNANSLDSNQPSKKTVGNGCEEDGQRENSQALVTAKSESNPFVIDRLSLTVADGELLVLLGPTGCGKSTTLRLIAGLETCDSGQILIDGAAAESAPHKRNLAFVFQEAALFPHLSVADNIAFGIGSNPDAGVFDVLRRFIRPVRKLFGRNRSNPTSSDGGEGCGIETRVRLTARRLGIEHLLNRQPHQLSGGERQRVALGRSIVRNPAAFLLDEPLSSVDQWQRTQIRTEIRKIQKDTQTSMVYVTHDLAEAVAVADRIAVMKDGEILQTGTPGELLYQPNCLFVAQFMGQFPMNWLIVPTGFATESRTDTDNNFASAVDDVSSETDECIVGIRAHLISIVPPEQGNLTGRIVDRRHACEGEVFEVELMLDERQPGTKQGKDFGGSPNFGRPVSFVDGNVISSGPNMPSIWTVHNPTSRQEIENITSGYAAGGNEPGRIEARSLTPAVGETIGLKFDPKDLHFFDLQTGQNLRKELDETK